MAEGSSEDLRILFLFFLLQLMAVVFKAPLKMNMGHLNLNFRKSLMLKMI